MIKEILTEFVQANEKIWEHDRGKTVGASEIGLCARRTYFAKNDASQDASYSGSWGAWVRGAVFEECFWAPALQEHYKDKILWSGIEQRTLVDGDLSATPDGLVIDQPRDALKHLGIKDIGPGRCFLVECKTIDPRVALGEAKAENRYQVQVQLGLVRKCTEYRPLYAVISYTNASIWDDVPEYAVKFDKMIYSMAKKRAREVLTAERAMDLPAEGWVAGGGECRYCSHTDKCGVLRRNLPNYDGPVEDLKEEEKWELIDLCKLARACQKARDSENEQYRLIQEEIRSFLRKRQLRRVPGVVSWSEVRGRKSYDMVAIREKLAELGADPEDYADVGEPTDRLTISDDL